MNQPSYYAIIPANVRYDKALPAGAKLMYGEITALSNAKGYCFASNGYFAELYGCTPQAISKWIKALETGGYVKIKYVGESGKQERRVSIAVDAYQPQLGGVSTQVDGVSTTVEYNNTSTLIQEDKSEAPAEKSDFFSPNKHHETAEYLIGYLEKNSLYLNGMAKGDWKRAVRGYTLKLQKNEKFYDLQVPKDEGAHYRWIAKSLAGIESWYKAAADIDATRNGGTAATPAPVIRITEAPKQEKIIRASAEEARKIAGI